MRSRLPLLFALALLTLPRPGSVHAAAPPDAAAKGQLGSFFTALRAAEAKGQDRAVRIAWWGDSAIVSDGYTGRLRERLQERFGDLGPGFLLADATFEGYLHDGVRMKRTGWSTNTVIQGSLKSGLYGYGGVQCESFGGASSTFEVEGAPITAVEVLYRGFPKSGGVQIFADDAGSATASHETAATPAKDGVWRWEAPAGGVKKVRVRAAGGGQTVLYGVALERGTRGVTLDTLGILGMRARRWLNADAEHLEQQVAARRPDLLVLNFGGNERVDAGLTAARHQEDIVAAMRALKAGAPDAACLIVGPIAHGVTVKGKVKIDPDLKTIYAGQRAAAAELGCAFFDTLAAMGGDDAVEIYRKKKRLGGDLAHLNGAGHKAVGDLLADWFLTTYDAWKSQTAKR